MDYYPQILEAVAYTALSLNVPYISEIFFEIKIKLKFYFHTSLGSLKRFYEDL